MKKAEMSLQLIITAVIVLIIAALLIFLVTSRVGLFGDTTGACYDRGGECRSQCDSGEQPYYLGNAECGDTQRCCIDGNELLGDN